MSRATASKLQPVERIGVKSIESGSSSSGWMTSKGAAASPDRAACRRDNLTSTVAGLVVFVEPLRATCNCRPFALPRP